MENRWPKVMNHQLLTLRNRKALAARRGMAAITDTRMRDKSMKSGLQSHLKLILGYLNCGPSNIVVVKWTKGGHFLNRYQREGQLLKRSSPIINSQLEHSVCQENFLLSFNFLNQIC